MWALGCLRLLCVAVGVRTVYRSVLLYLVKQTRLFNEQYYLENNPDIAESSMNPLFHYVVYGDKEGRSPSIVFDTTCYRSSSVGWTKHINALLHYSYVGRYCKSTPSPWFDVDYYLKNNKDVARADLDPLVHYLEWGGAEGRSPCPHFDGAYYLRKNLDICEARVNPLLHYLEYGRLEGRRTLPPFNPGYQETSDEELPTPMLPSEAQWKTISGCHAGEGAEIDVIMPVYRGKAETLRCIYSVLSSKNETEFELIVINDASPDKELTDALAELAETGLFSLIVNDINLGFVQTVNRGMQLHQGRDVVLLNSDTEVYDGWLDRLKTAADSHERVGTVTPLSNNATICSYPYFPYDNPFPLELEYNELDRVVANANKGVSVEAPTGVGFCMLIKKSCIAEVGVFDAGTFGKGYGEENDFCQRAIKKGWRNIIAADVFVRHWGSVSFQGEKASLAAKGLKLVEKKHPGYLSDVSEFIKNKPLSKIYQKIDWQRLLRLKREKNVLLICHSRGGGTEKRLQEDISYFSDKGYGTFLIRPVPDDPEKVAIEHPCVKWMPNISPVEWGNLKALINIVEELGINEVVSHSFVDFDKKVPSCLQELIQATGIKWVMNLHDYEVICPRINLVDKEGYYCGEPGIEGCNKCLRSNGSSFNIDDISEWRILHRAAMKAASRVVVPDDDVKRRLLTYFPDIATDAVPHEKDLSMTPRYKAIEIIPDEELKVVVIGAINKMKGYNVLLKCAQDASSRGLPIKFQLMGYSLNDRLLEEAGVEVSGKYKEENAVERLNEMNPHLVWIPSLWPETYCYTLSIAMKSGYSIMTFDIGAIPGRLTKYKGVSFVLPLEMAKYERRINTVLESVRERALVREVVKMSGDLVEAVVAYK